MTSKDDLWGLVSLNFFVHGLVHIPPPPPAVTQSLKVKDNFRGISRISEFRFQIFEVFARFLLKRENNVDGENKF
jgi:hypothetical protein